jgi:hypothetical protein
MIHQLNIVVNPETDVLDGYSNLEIDNIPQVTNGFVNAIIFTTIDKVIQQNRDGIFIELLKKLTRGGSLTVRFLNPESICQKIKNGTCSGSSFASMVNNIKSSWMEIEFLSLISSIQGVSLIKHIHEDVYSIAVIEKSK